MRLQKYISGCGFTSRRKAEALILEKRVKVNGEVIIKLGTTINPDYDIITIDNKRILNESEKKYILINKPTGYITSLKDQFNRPTVIDLIKENVKERVYPIGRLDYDTSGLLLLTNDGELTYKITHPKHEINKTYIARIKGIPDSISLNSFKKGLKIEKYITSPAKIKILKKDNDNCIVEITIREGKNRQVRKMCKSIGHPVISLKRIAIGSLKINELKVGKWRNLTKDEIQYLKSL